MSEIKVRNLIDLSDDTIECKSGTNDTNSDNSLPTIDSTKPLTSDQSVDDSRQLSGYLNKLSSRGPLRAMRKRWFVFNSNNCVLYYYRTRDDLLPLGEIEIRRATFTIKSQTVFTIISLDREMTLEANDSQQCLHWLTSLQTLRKKYIIDLAKKFGVKLALNNISQDINYEIDGKNNESDVSRSVFYSQSIDNQMSDSLYSSSSKSSNRSKNEDLTQFKSSDSPATKHKIFGGIVNKMKNKNVDIPQQRSRDSSISSPIRTLLKFSDKTDDSNCVKCRHSEEQLVSLSDDLSAIENELQASREVIKLLQKQLEIVNNEKKLLEDICKIDSKYKTNEMLTKLSQINEEMTKLKIELRNSEQNRDSILNENENLKSELNRFKEELSVLRETLESRDETVVSLTHQIFNLENSQNSGHNNNEYSSDSMTPKLIKIQTNELESLRDTVRAYETQNEFLNREIVELNELRNVVELKDKESQLRICELEAKCCQIQSKLLSLLKEINQSNQNISKTNDNTSAIAANEAVQTLVNRLLEETSLDIPLSWKPGNKSRNSGSVSPKSTIFDDLGFYYNKSNDFETISFDSDLFSSKEDSIKSEEQYIREKREIESKAKGLWKSKWDSFVGNLNNHELQKSQELKSMLRTGIPQEYRCKIWRGIIHMRVKNKLSECGPNYYQMLLKQSPSTGTKGLDPSAKQIELDLLRTLPNNKHFESLDSDGTVRLRRVLTAFSRHNQAVGYCQGLNRLAAVALLFMPEEDAFWCLVAIVETIMPNDYYGRNLLGAHVDQYVLRHLLTEKLPKLYAHLEQQGIELSLFSWFLTAFVDNIPVNVYLRIWDVFLYEGNKVLFRFALSFLKLHEESILKMCDSVTINQFLRTLGEREVDVRQLCNIAFCELNPFPYRTVKVKRIHYTTLVQSELKKLEDIRNSLPNHDRSFECESD